MVNVSEQYRFSDFTLANYERILAIAKQAYDFIFFDDITKANHKAIILRHDIEFSVPIALRMAEIEASMGIRASYFVQLHGDFYNALEKGTFKELKIIESLGHRLALHFDSHFWDIQDEQQIEKYLLIDKISFERYFNLEPYAFSFHNNTSFTLSCDKDFYAGMINVYGKNIRKKVGYCTDSTGYWRYEILENRLKEEKDQLLQVLIHDGMWQDEVLPPRRRIYKVLDDHSAYLKQTYDDILKKHGAKNIDWEGEV